MASTRATPWHVWVVGLLSLLWNCVGVYDYTQTQTGNLDYLADAGQSMGISAEEALAYYQCFPAWADAFWAFGVWGALLGSVLLLLRSGYAVWFFALSLLGLAVTTVYQVATPTPEWLQGGLNAIMTIIIWSVATFLLIYALRMKQKGLLR